LLNPGRNTPRPWQEAFLRYFSSIRLSNVSVYFCRINKSLTLLQSSVNRECVFVWNSFSGNDLDFDFYFVLRLIAFYKPEGFRNILNISRITPPVVDGSKFENDVPPAAGGNNRRFLKDPKRKESKIWQE